MDLVANVLDLFMSSNKMIRKVKILHHPNSNNKNKERMTFFINLGKCIVVIDISIVIILFAAIANKKAIIFEIAKDYIDIRYIMLPMYVTIAKEGGILLKYVINYL